MFLETIIFLYTGLYVVRELINLFYRDGVYFCILITQRYIEPLSPSHCFMCAHVYLPIKISTFCIQSPLVCLYLSQKKEERFYSIDILLFVSVAECVYCAI